MNIKPSITIAVQLKYLSKTTDCLKFKYGLTDSASVDLQTLVSYDTMSYNDHQNVYTLNANDVEALVEFTSSKL